MPRPTAHPRTDKIVVGVTHDRAARNALDWAIRTAVLNDSLLVVVTAYEIPRAVLTMYGWACFDIRDAEAAARFMQRNVLEDELPGTPSFVRLRRLVVRGDPIRVLVDVARDADLLVVGRQVRRIRHIAARSVSKGCASRADCPVVIVRDDVCLGPAAPALGALPVPTDGPRVRGISCSRDGRDPHHSRRDARFERRRH